MQERKYKTHQKYFDEDKETNEIIVTNGSCFVNHNIEIPGKVIDRNDQHKIDRHELIEKYLPSTICG